MPRKTARPAATWLPLELYQKFFAASTIFFVPGNTYVFNIPASKLRRGQVVGAVEARDIDQGLNAQVPELDNTISFIVNLAELMKAYSTH